MLKAKDIAEYFLRKDTNGNCFNFRLREENGHTFYEGNARLNKYLHMSQNLFLAKYDTLLFEDKLVAYDNGAVVPAVQRNFSVLVARKVEPSLPEDIKDFLDKVYTFFSNATIDELIELSHEDNEWIEKNRNSLTGQEMNTLSRSDEYKQQYSGALFVLDRM